MIAELQAGKTIAEVAGEHDVALDTIVDAFLAERAERLAEQVANGQLTQEEADILLVQMREQVTEQLSETWTPQSGQSGSGIGAAGNGVGDGSGFIDSDGDGVCDVNPQ